MVTLDKDARPTLYDVRSRLHSILSTLVATGQPPRYIKPIYGITSFPPPPPVHPPKTTPTPDPTPTPASFPYNANSPPAAPHTTPNASAEPGGRFIPIDDIPSHPGNSLTTPHPSPHHVSPSPTPSPQHPPSQPPPVAAQRGPPQKQKSTLFDSPFDRQQSLPPPKAQPPSAATSNPPAAPHLAHAASMPHPHQPPLTTPAHYLYPPPANHHAQPPPQQPPHTTPAYPGYAPAPTAAQQAAFPSAYLAAAAAPAGAPAYVQPTYRVPGVMLSVTTHYVIPVWCMSIAPQFDRKVFS